MTVTELKKDLKARKFSPIYLFHGEESYYIDLFCDFIEQNLLTEAEKGFNQTILYGRDTDITDVVNSVKRFPMMSDYQLVIVKEAQDMKWGRETDDKRGADPFLGYLENPSKSTVLVLCYKHSKFDKRKKAYKAIERSGVVFESATIYDNKVAGWVEDFIRERAYRINPRAAVIVAEYLGNDLSKISNELEKLMLNIEKGKEISIEDIQRNIGISKEYNVFELQDALARKDVVKANRIVNYFGVNSKSNPIQMVLGALSTWFTKILKYHYITDKAPQNLSKELGVHSFFVKDYDLAAKTFSLSKTFFVIDLLRQYDLKAKGVDASANTEDVDLLKELVFKILH